MARPKGLTFLAREGYRRRRLVDTARILPVVGGLMFLAPILWEAGGPIALSTRVILLFTVWLALVVAAAALAPALRRALGEGAQSEPPDRPGEDPGA